MMQEKFRNKQTSNICQTWQISQYPHRLLCNTPENLLVKYKRIKTMNLRECHPRLTISQGTTFPEKNIAQCILQQKLHIQNEQRKECQSKVLANNLGILQKYRNLKTCWRKRKRRTQATLRVPWQLSCYQKPIKYEESDLKPQMLRICERGWTYNSQLSGR